MRWISANTRGQHERQAYAYKKLWLLGTSLCAAGVFPFGSFAFAQGASTAASSDEIIVSATRRSESLAEVPLSVTAYSQENMDRKGIGSVLDIAAQTPGVDIPTGRTYQRISIRGIDSNSGAATTAVYIDDIPIQARNAAINYAGSTIPYIFDLERIEVLRGPQGTLFGANAQGGAIRFITPTPSLTEYSGYGRLQANALDGGGTGFDAGLAVGGPIVEDKLGFRLSAYRRETGGWVDRQSWQNPLDREEDANTAEATILRAAVLWQASDWLSISPSVYYQYSLEDDRGGSALYTRCPAATPLDPALDPCPLGDADPDSGNFINYAAIAQPSEDKFVVPSLKFVAEGGGVELTSVTSYLYRKVSQTNDATHGNDRISLGAEWLFPIVPGWDEAVIWQSPVSTQKLLTQEVRLSSTDDDARLKWTLGTYYSNSKLHSDLPIAHPHFPDSYFADRGVPLPNPGDMVDGIYRYYGVEDTEESSISFFGNIDFDVLENLTVSVGARYGFEKLDYNIVERGVSYAGGIATAAGELKEEPFTPRVAVSWQATPDNLFYASYAKGYRPGGTNKAVPDLCAADLAVLGIPGGETYASDETSSYEVGWKASLFEGLSFQASAYRTKWDDIQQRFRLPCAFSLVANTATAVSKGVDLSFSYRPVEQLVLTGAFGYTDAEYTETVIVGSAPIVSEGETLGAPPFTLNIAGEYTFDVFDSRDGFVRLQYNHRQANDGPYAYQIPASSLYDPTRAPGADQSRLDVRLGWLVTPDLTLEFIAENVLNNVDLLGNDPVYNGGPLWFGYTQRPRMLAVQASMRF